MWNISFKIYKEGELTEEGFETSSAHDLNHALQEVDTILDLEDADKVEIQINRVKWNLGEKLKSEW